MSFIVDHKDEIKILIEILNIHVKDKFNVDISTLDEVKIESRKRPIVYFRKILIIILGETFNNKYNQEEIAGVVGLDRTSLIYHSKMHLSDYTKYSKYKKEYDEIRNNFLQRIGKNYEN